MYNNITQFYSNNHDILFGKLKPSKSIVKDVETCFNNFKIYLEQGNEIVSKELVPQIIGKDVDENTRNQNIRVMQEFGFLSDIRGTSNFEFTSKFKAFCSSNLPLGYIVLESLYKISDISSLTMYLNYLLSTLREAYTFGSVILFPDSKDKFISKVPEKTTRDSLRERVFQIYGFIGDTRREKPHLTSDEYTPNASYMSRTELENLGLLIKGEKEYGLDCLVLTSNGHHLLKAINDNLSCISEIDNPYKICDFVGDTSPIILYGPPGTGKTYRLQHDYLAHFDKRLTFFTTFHQSFAYEEFVEGLKPSLGDSDEVKYNIEQGVFFKACEKAAKIAGYDSLKDAVCASIEDRKEKFGKAIDNNNLVLLCIDEINRGNVASIFGDLISLIEPSKRLGNKDELILTLPYSKERFGVPPNLLIVGTMNTADRSIQLLDSALRRRFRFEELPPLLDKINHAPAKEVLRAINKRIRAILNKDAQIGHAYFIDVESDEETLDVIAKKVIPLLEEYFYNDIDKIRFVLNDYGEEVKFYLEDAETKEAYEIYLGKADMDSEEKNFFYLNPQISGVEGLSENLMPNKTYPAADFLNQIIG